MTNPLSSGEWLREPAHATVDAELVRFTTSPGTDLWQRTYYGFRNHNAPALLLPATRNMTLMRGSRSSTGGASTRPASLAHDNADNMGEGSIEHENDMLSRLGSVVTNSGYSDWATRDTPSTGTDAGTRSRARAALPVEAGPDGTAWEQLRVFHLHGLGETTKEFGSAAVLPDGSTVGIGVYACSPEDSSFEAQFDQIRLEPSVWQPHAG